MPLFYQLWTGASEYYLERAGEFSRKGYILAGLERLQESVEEARCLLGNIGLEDEMPPIEELLKAARPQNPRPDATASNPPVE